MSPSNLPLPLQRWIDLDPDSEMVDQLIELHRCDPSAAKQLFEGRIGFGTAGLRAAMGPGPNAMNRVVVRQTTAGLVSWFGERRSIEAPSVVIGFDARHRSEQFATDAAREIVEGGGVVYLFDQAASTPVVAHEGLRRGADATIVVTASHNPPADNGYKLYLGDGIQLIPPADDEIAKAIDGVAQQHQQLQQSVVPADRDRSVVDLVGIARLGGELRVCLAAEATAAHRSIAVSTVGGTNRQIKVLYTAMHGVGGRAVVEAMVEAGFPEPTVVAEQFEPDPDFPTTPFPNPEESGALDLAFQTADAAADAPDLILANDPDADRLAVAVPTSDGWHRLSGDDVGALLADHLLRRRGADTERGALVVSSIVSSRFINVLASHYGAESVRTLTGFKWVARPIVDRPDVHYVFGYEEALGYCVNPAVRDKDGIASALVVAEIAADCRAEGTTLLERLDQMAEQFGLFATSQISVAFGHLDLSGQQELRATAGRLNPTDLAGVAVTSVEFLDEGRHLPPTVGVCLDLADGSRVIVRPSGTEPKVKAYFEVVTERSADVPLALVKENANNRLARLEEAVKRLLTS